MAHIIEAPPELEGYKPQSKPGKPKCFNCHETEGLTEESFCFGCAAYICEDCEGDEFLMGNHEPSNHVLPEKLRTDVANQLIALIRAGAFPDAVLWMMQNHPDTDPFVRAYLEDLSPKRALPEHWQDHIRYVIHQNESELGWSECNAQVRLLESKLMGY
jgi:hypothetical protein